MPPRLSINTDLTSSVNAPLVGYSQQQQRVFPSDVLRVVRSVYWVHHLTSHKPSLTCREVGKCLSTPWAFSEKCPTLASDPERKKERKGTFTS
jgi:hypothetical protein